MKMDFVISNAADVSRGIVEPIYKRSDYEDAMMEVARLATPPGDSTAMTFARLLEKGDKRILDLYSAARRADDIEAVAKSARSQERQQIYERMTKYAAASRRPGESEEQAYVRMLEEDPTMQRLYEQYRGT